MSRKRTRAPEPTSLSGWALAVVRTISAAGVDPHPLLQQAGIDNAALTDPEARVPVASMTKLWRLAIDATGDEALGLRTPDHVDPSSMFAMQTLTLSAPTAEMGWNQFSRYLPVLSTGLKIELHKNAEQDFTISLQTADPRMAAFEAGDASVACLIANLRNLKHLGVTITAIDLFRPEPQAADEFERLLGAPVSFEQKATRVHFSTERPLHTPQETANPALEQALQQVLQDYMERLRSTGFQEQVKREIARAMTHGEPSLAKVAEQMHISGRTLQRHLVDEDSSFSDLVNDVRQNMAKQLVGETDLNITDIAFRLGFRDASNFSRVFRRWFGQTPREFRKQP
ncbi:AraC family transcriptional regulator [Pseudomaricurvus alkylphenolicus]|uniref:AraC family transcriptional regulator n=1 Tax=Pseudomaricurvus alkylphenolicus TaxID=1306991 RepID=UPI001423AFEA|nr:AraC family transcriptional regulator [Pseudomaricurvus alkylphenolicus]NIB39861.1 AraC family transcriptional regulator [Pseudomaricurvus alkylphenolicus]